jgi:MtN3 and saliva related transmembrane protein
MVLIVVTSTLVWLTYGYLNNLGPVLLANTVVLVLTLVLLYFKTKFKA